MLLASILTRISVKMCQSYVRLVSQEKNNSQIRLSKYLQGVSMNGPVIQQFFGPSRFGKKVQMNLNLNFNVNQIYVTIVTQKIQPPRSKKSLKLGSG